ncbi:hypothetical protein HanIR_Chr14g0685361 [Helianthus annuus]|nr:hypothetical protein HanIR_Chr14g0685361 [Helianthus annuus]
MRVRKVRFSLIRDMQQYSGGSEQQNHSRERHSIRTKRRSHSHERHPICTKGNFQSFEIPFARRHLFVQKIISFTSMDLLHSHE